MKTVFSIVFLLLAGTMYAQGHKQVSWTFNARTSESKTELVMKATVEKGWHIYSQFMVGDGPVPTSFTYTLPQNIVLDGKTKEPAPIKHFDENFQMEVKYFNKEVEFVQPLKGAVKQGQSVTGMVSYMICNDEMCLPPVDVEFEIKL